MIQWGIDYITMNIYGGWFQTNLAFNGRKIINACFLDQNLTQTPLSRWTEDSLSQYVTIEYQDTNYPYIYVMYFDANGSSLVLNP